MNQKNLHLWQQNLEMKSCRVIAETVYGRSALGVVLSVGGAGIGLGPASVIPAALSSPRIAAGSLATSDVIEDLAKFGANKANKLTRPIRGLSGISSGIQNSLQK